MWILAGASIGNVFVWIETFGTGATAMIIDGQQRMITTTILLSVLRMMLSTKFKKKFNSKKYKQQEHRGLFTSILNAVPDGKNEKDRQSRLTIKAGKERLLQLHRVNNG